MAAVRGYEEIRLALAADDWDKTKKSASALAGAAEKASAAAEGDVKTALAGIAAAAKAVAGASDIEASRAQPFGDLSKHTIGLIAKTPGLDKGVTCYRCPMAKAYKKWIQLDSEMANPYMGKRMLKCGGKVPLEV